MRIHEWRFGAWLILALTLTIGCQKREREVDPEEAAGRQTPREETTVSITEVQLGKEVNSAHQVEDPTDRFAPSDTIFASVKTEETPAGTTIVARWLYTEGDEEQVVAEDRHTTDRGGTGYTSFFISSSTPWPTGTYELRIVTDGQVRETKRFSVKG